MDSETRIRQAEPADAPGIARVHVAAWQAAYRGLLPDRTLDDLTLEAVEKRWAERLAGPEGAFLVLTRGARIAGFAGFGPAQDEDADPETVGEIYMLYVAPDAWRQGYGTALLHEAVARLHEGGRTEIVLWVLYNNEGAIAFYEASGFVADGTRRVKTRPDGTTMTVARYRRRGIQRSSVLLPPVFRCLF